MSSEQAAPPPKRARWGKLRVLVAAFLISLTFGWIFERITDPETLAGAHRAQTGWIASAEAAQPLALGSLYLSELSRHNTTERGGIAALPLAFLTTCRGLFRDGRLWSLTLVFLAGLSLALYNAHRSQGRTFFYDNLMANLLGGPVVIIALASLISLGIWGLMLAALYLLSGITQFAAASAGATGVAGFCWYCFAKLAEKGAETAITPRA
jgi:hypothetical protein